MLIKRILMFAISSGLAAAALQLYLDQRRQRREQHERQQHREAMQRWEDEGGSPRPA